MEFSQELTKTNLLCFLFELEILFTNISFLHSKILDLSLF